MLGWVLSGCAEDRTKPRPWGCLLVVILEPELPVPHPGAGVAREEEAGGTEGRGWD